MNLSGLLPLLDQLSPAQGIGRSADRFLSLPAPFRPYLVAWLRSRQPVPFLLLTGRVESVPVWQQALESWLPPTVPVLRFPEPTPLPWDRAPWSDTSRLDRIIALTRLLAGQHPLLPAAAHPPVIVASVRALLQKGIPRRTLISSVRVLKQGQLIDLEKTVQSWLGLGYERVSTVVGPCQFSHRGGILDIHAPMAPWPVRIELFGDEIDTLRYFDPQTQRTIAGAVTQVVIPPVREALPHLAPAVGERLAALADPPEDDLPSWQDDLPGLLSGEPFPHLEYYLPYFYAQPGNLLDFLPEDGLVVVDDLEEIEAAVRDLEGRAAQTAGEQLMLPPDYPRPLFEWVRVRERLTNRPMGLHLEDQAGQGETGLSADAPITLADLVQPGPRHGGQQQTLLADLKRALDLRQRTVVVSRQAQRLAELWRGGSGWTLLEGSGGHLRPLESLPWLPDPATLTFVTGTLGEGFVLEDERGNVLLNLLSDAEIFGWNRPAPRRRRLPAVVAPETYFSDINPGDYVVHIEYGVGRFVGMVVRNIGGARREYLQLNYANSDVLYVPVHHADRLSRWIGADGHPPSLHRVGEKGWRAAREQARRAVAELADELLTLYAQRETIPGHAFAPDGEWQAELEAAFPYSETEDQVSAIAAVKADMEKGQPMDRLICGDVGFGKTEVALRAAFKAVMDNRQVALLVPTTVLAQQHFQTFCERLAPFPVEVGILSRFQTPRQIAGTLKQLREGGIDIVIGTHRLLSDDVSFRDLGLLVIDEEQRFGVTHKEKLKRLRSEVDVLTLSATPIPRTLYMGLSGLRDISVINTPPGERLPIQTYVGAGDDRLIRRAILRELDRGGQIYFVHNHVQTIEAARRRVVQLAPQARVAVGHGQMDEHELERVMGQFAAHEVDILVCTTIIESGLDIPNANTLIVDRAELFGLSQLYQLRGRVGRGTQRAYAYFFHAAWNSLTPEARERLETIDTHTDLGAGYSIAMRDLEIRGAGELLGGEQSGHIASVGFDLYLRMLAQAVKSRKAAREGELVSADLPIAITIDLPLAAYIPTDYVADAALRLRLYRRMAGLESLPAIEAMAEELTDRFGPLPEPLENLLYQLRIKALATAAGVPSIATENRQIKLRMVLEYADRVSLQHFLGDGVRVSKSAIWLNPEAGTHAWQVRLVQVLEKLGSADAQQFGMVRLM
jgi:transcription-repair coupling factor (superfamily II helicase)